jgi:hypothetical protein
LEEAKSRDPFPVLIKQLLDAGFSKEEIQAVAKKYLNPNQRLILDYVPASDKTQN